MWQQIMSYYHDSFMWPARRLHSEYRITISMNQSIGFKVWESTEGTFIGDCEYAVKGSSCATPYSSGKPQSTPEDALEDAMKGFFNFLDKGATLHSRWDDREPFVAAFADDDDD